MSAPNGGRSSAEQIQAFLNALTVTESLALPSLCISVEMARAVADCIAKPDAGAQLLERVWAWDARQTCGGVGEAFVSIMCDIDRFLEKPR